LKLAETGRKNFMFLKLLVCKGHSEYDAWTGDYDFWCDYGDETVPDECDDCLCGWKEYDGRDNPKTGRKILWLAAFILYGPPCTETPCCKNCYWAKGKWKDGRAICPILKNNGKGRAITKKEGFLCRDYKWKHTRRTAL
jgi:hypothetical protein